MWTTEAHMAGLWGSRWRFFTFFRATVKVRQLGQRPRVTSTELIEDRNSPYSRPSTAVPPAVCITELGIQGWAASQPALRLSAANYGLVTEGR